MKIGKSRIAAFAARLREEEVPYAEGLCAGKPGRRKAGCFPVLYEHFVKPLIFSKNPLQSA